MNIKIEVGNIICKIESNEKIVNLIKENCNDFLTNKKEDFFIKII